MHVRTERPPGEPADASFPEDRGGRRRAAGRRERRGPAAVLVGARPARHHRQDRHLPLHGPRGTGDSDGARRLRGGEREGRMRGGARMAGSESEQTRMGFRLGRVRALRSSAASKSVPWRLREAMMPSRPADGRPARPPKHGRIFAGGQVTAESALREAGGCVPGAGPPDPRSGSACWGRSRTHAISGELWHARHTILTRT